MKPSRSESCPSGQHRRPTAPEEDIFPSQDQKYVHTSATSTPRERKQLPPGSIAPRTVWKTHPHWLSVDRLGLTEPACGESCPSGQHRGPVASGEDRVPSPDQKSLHTSTTPTPRCGINRVALKLLVVEALGTARRTLQRIFNAITTYRCTLVRHAFGRVVLYRTERRTTRARCISARKTKTSYCRLVL